MATTKGARRATCIFDVNRRIVGDYASYVGSFLEMVDDGILAELNQELAA